MNDEMFDDLYKSIKGAGEMNDESKKNDKKLSLFEKYMNAVPRSRIQHGGSRTWAAAFKEMLRIIDHWQETFGRNNGIHTLRNVRRAICDELGLAGNEKSEAAEPIESKAENDSTSDFMKHLLKVSKFVETWPDWEQKILGVAGRSPYDESPSDVAKATKSKATKSKTVEPDTSCPKVFRSGACGSKSSEHYDSCGKTLDDCKKLGNAHNFGGVGYDKTHDAKEPSTRGVNYCDCPYDNNCSDGMRDRCKSDTNLKRIERLEKSVRQLQFWRTAREFYGVTKHGDK